MRFFRCFIQHTLLQKKKNTLASVPKWYLLTVCVCTLYMHFYYNFWNITQENARCGYMKLNSANNRIFSFAHLQFCSYYVLLASNFVV